MDKKKEEETRKLEENRQRICRIAFEETHLIQKNGLAKSGGEILWNMQKLL